VLLRATVIRHPRQQQRQDLLTFAAPYFSDGTYRDGPPPPGSKYLYVRVDPAKTDVYAQMGRGRPIKLSKYLKLLEEHERETNYGSDGETQWDHDNFKFAVYPPPPGEPSSSGRPSSGKERENFLFRFQIPSGYTQEPLNKMCEVRLHMAKVPATKIFGDGRAPQQHGRRQLGHATAASSRNGMGTGTAGDEGVWIYCSVVPTCAARFRTLAEYSEHVRIVHGRGHTISE
jgi:hypothetical protein